ncbi:MAG: Spore cortex-lytic enzyme precursor [Firmicutes bacterium ADurb.Bin193]|nr:MAG: Spore cortex-lytic enzyme precursor [Firmicutes bacterium ADurb.Bin193]
MKKLNRKGFLILFAVIILLFAGITFQYSAVPTLSRYGSRGPEVREIQTRLKKWGYKITAIDGIYGPNTRSAVIQFQRNNGLKPDGIAGPATLGAMGISSRSSYDNNVQLLARIISAESRGEPYAGQVAVGAVVLNRVKHPSFPNTISGVIYQPGAFTAITDGQFNAQVVSSAYNAARDALNGWDPSNGAIYYYNPAKTTNKWIYSRPVVARIGKHVFAK